MRRRWDFSRDLESKSVESVQCYVHVTHQTAKRNLVDRSDVVMQAPSTPRESTYTREPSPDMDTAKSSPSASSDTSWRSGVSSTVSNLHYPARSENIRPCPSLYTPSKQISRYNPTTPSTADGSRKKLSRSEPIKCHHCVNTKHPQVHCTKCLAGYCIRCLGDVYDTDVDPSSTKFICPKCDGYCECRACRGDLGSSDSDSVVEISDPWRTPITPSKSSSTSSQRSKTSIYCHHCRRPPTADHRRIQCLTCSVGYCTRCLRKHYNASADETFSCFVCPRCKCTCTCTVCR
jgi:hypothetical protein